MKTARRDWSLEVLSLSWPSSTPWKSLEEALATPCKRYRFLEPVSRAENLARARERAKAKKARFHHKRTGPLEEMCS